MNTEHDGISFSSISRLFASLSSFSGLLPTHVWNPDKLATRISSHNQINKESGDSSSRTSMSSCLHRKAHHFSVSKMRSALFKKQEDLLNVLVKSEKLQSIQSTRLMQHAGRTPHQFLVCIYISIINWLVDVYLASPSTLWRSSMLGNTMLNIGLQKLQLFSFRSMSFRQMGLKQIWTVSQGLFKQQSLEHRKLRRVLPWLNLPTLAKPSIHDTAHPCPSWLTQDTPGVRVYRFAPPSTPSPTLHNPSLHCHAISCTEPTNILQCHHTLVLQERVREMKKVCDAEIQSSGDGLLRILQ